MQFSSPIKQKLSEPLNVKLVLSLLQQEPTPSRHSLAKDLCRHLDLRDAKGDWQMATTSKARVASVSLRSRKNRAQARFRRFHVGGRGTLASHPQPAAAMACS